MLGMMDVNGAGVGAIIGLVEVLIIMALIGLSEMRGRFEK
jgi:hypothetical protein